MKIALATTTIHIPHAFKLMRETGGFVRFFVAGDMRTPVPEAYQFMAGIFDCMAFVPEEQSHWKCSEAIGWNTLARRNIAFLEALKWGADVIISWDTDNYPTSASYFSDFARCFERPFSGLMVGGYDWFDSGALLVPKTKQRGFPHDMPHMSKAVPVTGIKVGVAAGLIIGNPDVDATTRMELKPDIGMVHVLGDVGVVVDKSTHTVFNTQSTAMVRALIPAWFLMPGVGRMDDIYASLIVQRVARERGYHVHFGRPIAFQERHAHNLVTDLRAEIDGYENVVKLTALLDAIDLSGRSVVDDTRVIYRVLGDAQKCTFIPASSCVAAALWLDDCESVLA